MEERLVKFARIVDAGSFTRAARGMHISQPALTSAVKKLERELQAELLIRSNHALKLTAAGEVAYDTAKNLMVQTQNLHVQIREAAQQKILVNVGMIDSMAELLFTNDAYLKELEQEAQLALTIDNSTRLMDQVEHDTLDAAFIAKPERLATGLASETIGDEPLVLVTHTAQVGDLQTDLAQKHVQRFLSYNQGSQTQGRITQHFADQGIELETTFYSTSPEIMLQLVTAGRGSAVLPYLLVQPYLEKGELVAVRIGMEGAVINRPIVRVQRSGRIMPAQMQRASRHMQDQLSALRRAAKHL